MPVRRANIEAKVASVVIVGIGATGKRAEVFTTSSKRPKENWTKRAESVDRHRESWMMRDIIDDVMYERRHDVERIKRIKQLAEENKKLRERAYWLAMCLYAALLYIFLSVCFSCQKPTPPPEMKLMMQPVERRQLKWQQREVFHEWLSPDAWSAKGKADGTIIVPWHKRRVDLEMWAWMLKDEN